MKKRQQAEALEAPSSGGRDVENPPGDDGPSSGVVGGGGDDAAPAGAATAFASGNDRGPPPLAAAAGRVLRWCCANKDEGPTTTERWTVLGFSGSVLGGMITGVIVTIFLILLDYSDVIHLDGAHNFRNEAHRAFVDPATIKAIEETTGMKVLVPAEYDKLRSELETTVKQRAELEEKLAKREAEAKENEEVQAEHDALVESLGLKNFCNACATIFDDGEDAIRCDARAGLLAYQRGEGKPGKVDTFRAMLEVMEETPVCRKK